MKNEDITIVLCCADMETRLGIGTSKALISIDDKPLIVRQLELLSDYDDIRIVVGYQAEKIIDIVTKYRKDIMFVFNYDYDKTSIVYSLKKALVSPREYVVELDGDLLINSADFKAFMNYPDECVAITDKYSDNPILMTENNGKVISLSKENGTCEWTGLMKVKSARVTTEKKFIYELIEPLFPLPAVRVNARDIDTYDDYDKALIWHKESRNEEHI